MKSFILALVGIICATAILAYGIKTYRETRLVELSKACTTDYTMFGSTQVCK